MIKLKKRRKSNLELNETRLRKLNNQGRLLPELEDAFYIRKEIEELILPALKFYLEVGYIEEHLAPTLEKALNIIYYAALELENGELEALLEKGLV